MQHLMSLILVIRPLLQPMKLFNLPWSIPMSMWILEMMRLTLNFLQMLLMAMSEDERYVIIIKFYSVIVIINFRCTVNGLFFMCKMAW